MQTIGSILDVGLSLLRSVESSETVRDAVDRMCEINVDSLIVVNENADVIGIVRERDILRGVVAAELDPRLVRVEQVMTNDMVTISPRASLEEAMAVMHRSCQQELVVAEDDMLCGVISHCEISNTLMNDRDARIGDLTFYITHG